VRVKSVWPGGEVELPEFWLAGDPLVMAPLPRKVHRKVHRLQTCATRPDEGLRAVVLGLARPGIQIGKRR
jgi:hypothetical protein